VLEVVFDEYYQEKDVSLIVTMRGEGMKRDTCGVVMSEK
jgi:hypothetical protein